VRDYDESADTPSKRKDIKEMRIQLEVPTKTAQRIKALMVETELKTYSDLFANALTALEWMVHERKEGLMVVSTDRNFTRPTALSMPILDRVTPIQAAAANVQSAPVGEQSIQVTQVKP
jgi:hypothetical protein